MCLLSLLRMERCGSSSSSGSSLVDDGGINQLELDADFARVAIVVIGVNVRILLHFLFLSSSFSKHAFHVSSPL